MHFGKSSNRASRNWKLFPRQMFGVSCDWMSSGRSHITMHCVLLHTWLVRRGPTGVCAVPCFSRLDAFMPGTININILPHNLWWLYMTLIRITTWFLNFTWSYSKLIKHLWFSQICTNLSNLKPNGLWYESALLLVLEVLSSLGVLLKWTLSQGFECKSLIGELQWPSVGVRRMMQKVDQLTVESALGVQGLFGGAALEISMRHQLQSSSHLRQEEFYTTCCQLSAESSVDH